MQQIVYLALAFGSASAFVAPAAQAASSQLRSTPAEEIGVDPGPFGMTGAVPSGKFWEEQDGLARAAAPCEAESASIPLIHDDWAAFDARRSSRRSRSSTAASP